MNTIERRRLAFQAYPTAGTLTRQTDRKARAVELILTAGHDAEHPWRDTLNALQGIRPDLTADGIDELVQTLLDLADEVAEWESKSRMGPPFHAACDDYDDALHDFVTGGVS